jgi:hypothetical protein
MLLACCGSAQQQLVLHDLVASMGGTFAYMFDPSITHLIFGTRTGPHARFALLGAAAAHTTRCRGQSGHVEGASISQGAQAHQDRVPAVAARCTYPHCRRPRSACAHVLT